MGQRNTDTAVLIFSLSAQRESERKPLFTTGKQQSTNEFFEILIGRTQKIAAASGVDAFLVNERQQLGRTFAERYANAFQRLFDQGYTKVVSIGNDTPDLTAETLRKAIDEIQCKDLVVGPSTDGGVYLLGLGSTLFHTDRFLALPWLQDSLCDALIQSDYWQKGGCFALDELSDIDDVASLLKFANSTSNAYLRAFILTHLFLSKTAFGNWKNILPSDAHMSSLHLRGPPSFQMA